ncbi:hypothetical protein CRG98_028519 [Punica granatum]|uniref:Uncharacterized protein n=1 Tax=Punica granatum TaxID=22663 RepID=A0A2I0J5A3_PUNGR|nr:hypothetical protein CRG98_028519 [Punica granatum]
MQVVMAVVGPTRIGDELGMFRSQLVARSSLVAQMSIEFAMYARLVSLVVFCDLYGCLKVSSVAHTSVDPTVNNSPGFTGPSSVMSAGLWRGLLSIFSPGADLSSAPPTPNNPKDQGNHFDSDCTTHQDLILGVHEPLVVVPRSLLRAQSTHAILERQPEPSMQAIPPSIATFLPFGPTIVQPNPRVSNILSSPFTDFSSSPEARAKRLRKTRDGSRELSTTLKGKWPRAP